ncbi:MAG: prepilin-type N-terminal cleavage/methylation domain-containing protein [Desulfobacteraceae bacterium]
MDRLIADRAQNSDHATGPGGFTLLEVMVALAVLATTLTVIYQLHGQTMMISSNARFYNLAPMLAQAKLSEVELSTYKELTESSGDFGEDYPGFQWSVRIEDAASDMLEDLLEAKPYHFTRIEIVVSNDDESTYNLRTYRFFVD